MTGVRSDWARDPTAAMWWKPENWAVHCWETKRAREEESAARRACGEEEKEVRREGVKEIEMKEGGKKGTGVRGKAVLLSVRVVW